MVTLFFFRMVECSAGEEKKNASKRKVLLFVLFFCTPLATWKGSRAGEMNSVMGTEGSEARGLGPHRPFGDCSRLISAPQKGGRVRLWSAIMYISASRGVCRVQCGLLIFAKYISSVAVFEGPGAI